jgi:hypothetical protein
MPGISPLRHVSSVFEPDLRSYSTFPTF